MVQTIVAIGGGEIGRPGYSIETTEIDQEIIKLSGKEAPKLLFIPTASSDSLSYCEVVKEHFGDRLGCEVDNLLLIGTSLTLDEIKEKINSADIIYVGGGNTLKMLNVWKECGADSLLKLAWENGKIISGLSAGAVCWFKYFNSDTKKFTEGKEEYDLIKLKGLGWINGTFVPHFDTEVKREKHLQEMMKETEGIAIALDNCCAIVIQDEQCKIVTSKATARAYKIYYSKDKKYIKSAISKKKQYSSLKSLLSKDK